MRAKYEESDMAELEKAAEGSPPNLDAKRGKVLAYRVSVKRLAFIVLSLAETGSCSEKELEQLKEISRG